MATVRQLAKLLGGGVKKESRYDLSVRTSHGVVLIKDDSPFLRNWQLHQKDLFSSLKIEGNLLTPEDMGYSLKNLVDAGYPDEEDVSEVKALRTVNYDEWEDDESLTDVNVAVSGLKGRRLTAAVRTLEEEGFASADGELYTKGNANDVRLQLRAIFPRVEVIAKLKELEASNDIEPHTVEEELENYFRTGLMGGKTEEEIEAIYWTGLGKRCLSRSERQRISAFFPQIPTDFKTLLDIVEKSAKSSFTKIAPACWRRFAMGLILRSGGQFDYDRSGRTLKFNPLKQ